MEEAFPRAVKSLPRGHYTTLQMQRVLARALAEVGRLEDAERVCKEALEEHRRTHQQDHGAARAQLYLGWVLVQEGKLDEAEPLLEKAMKFFRADPASKPKPELAAQAANWLGAILVRRNDFSEAEKLMLPDSDRFFAAGAEMS